VFAAGAFGATSKLTLTSPGFKFDKKTLAAKPGTVSITLTNKDSSSHNVAIKQGTKVIKKGPVVGKGKKSIVTSNLKKGSYTFYCSVPGHEAAGMKGTLTVK
jgi:plastocyanin